MFDAGWLILAGAAMGFVNNLAGAGGVLGLLAFDLVAGLPITTANASLRPAALAISISGALGFVSTRTAVPARSLLYGLAAVPGAVAGAVLAVELPPLVYRLSLVAVILLLLAKMLRERRDATHRPPQRLPPWLAIGLFTLVGLHMGFLQVGVGLLIMATLSVVHSSDLVAVNAAKMGIVFATSLASVTTLSLKGAIDWPPALWLALGAGVGSFLAGRWSVRKGHAAIRSFVVVVCVLALVRTAASLL